MGQTTQLAALLVAGDPRGAADRILDFLVSLNRARCAAVFALDGERLILFTGRGFGLEVLRTVETAWTNHRAELATGEILRSTDLRASYVVAPLTEKGTLVALLYLDVATGTAWTALDISSLTSFGVAIGQAVIAAASATPAPSPVQTYLSQTRDEDIARERLLLLLVQNEWNIARVARLMGITRRTIYHRLQRHNIAREKVRKTELAPRRSVLAPA